MHLVRVVLVACLIAGLVPVVAAPAGASSPVPQLRRDGRWLVDQDGRVVLVHGVNLVWKLGSYVPPDEPAGFTSADAAWLAEHGFNGARIGTLWAGVTPTEPDRVDARYLAQWQRVMDDLAANQIWMQLDFHQDQWNEVYGGEGVPDWAVHRPAPYDLAPPLTPPFPLGYWTPEQSTVWDEFWAGRHGLIDAWAGAWRAVAAHWRGQPYLMGYDLLNEPWAGLEWPECLFDGCPTTYERELQPAMTTALRAIREADPSGIVWFEPQQLAGGRGTPTYFTAIAGEEQLGFSWHNYCPQVFFESQGIPGQDVEECQAYADGINRTALDQGDRMKAVGLMSEFGATDNERALEIDTEVADRHFTSWMYWAYKVWNDPTTADTAQGLFHDDADLASGKPKLRSLVRTYPQATCGTPASLSFDPRTGDFAYTYEAGSCHGRPTDVFISPLHYPRGFDLAVDGGTARPARDNHLLVDAVAGAEVTVRVTPRDA